LMLCALITSIAGISTKNAEPIHQPRYATWSGG
jgi:hypothetical protein